MGEGFLRSFDPAMEVISAGTRPEKEVSLYAVKVMKELGIDISGHRPKNVDQFVNDSFDYVITVCDSARENCPYFTGKVGQRLHIGFVDPADARGTEEEILAEYRRIRDQINIEFRKVFKSL
jgi:arsenate reductase (thioredoxin)